MLLRKKHNDQRGGMMLEAILAVGIIAATGPLLISQLSKRSEDLDRYNLGEHMAIVKKAADKYLESHGENIAKCYDYALVDSFAQDPGNPCKKADGTWQPYAPDGVNDQLFTITVADLLAEDLLPTGFENYNAAGQAYLIGARRVPNTNIDPTACVLTDRTGDGLSDGDACEANGIIDPEDENARFGGCTMKLEAMLLAQPKDGPQPVDGDAYVGGPGDDHISLAGLAQQELVKVAKVVGPTGGIYSDFTGDGEPDIQVISNAWSGQVLDYFADLDDLQMPYVDVTGRMLGYNVALASYAHVGKASLLNEVQDPNPCNLPDDPDPVDDPDDPPNPGKVCLYPWIYTDKYDWVTPVEIPDLKPYDLMDLTEQTYIDAQVETLVMANQTQVAQQLATVDQTYSLNVESLQQQNVATLYSQSYQLAEINQPQLKAVMHSAIAPQANFLLPEVQLEVAHFDAALHDYISAGNTVVMPSDTMWMNDQVHYLNEVYYLCRDIKPWIIERANVDWAHEVAYQPTVALDPQVLLAQPDYFLQQELPYDVVNQPWSCELDPACDPAPPVANPGIPAFAQQEMLNQQLTQPSQLPALNQQMQMPMNFQ